MGKGEAPKTRSFEEARAVLGERVRSRAVGEEHAKRDGSRAGDGPRLRPRRPSPRPDGEGRELARGLAKRLDRNLLAERRGQATIRYADVAVLASILRDDLGATSLRRLYI
jgi:hypothetical protein